MTDLLNYLLNSADWIDYFSADLNTWFTSRYLHVDPCIVLSELQTLPCPQRPSSTLNMSLAKLQKRMPFKS